MRKGYYLGVGILVSALALAGCESGSFKAERAMYRAHKKAETVFKNPKSTPPFQFDQAVKGYRDIAARYPNTLMAVQAQFSVGHLYLVKGDFEKARAEYKTMTTDCDKKGNLCAEAYYAVGNSYELEDRWLEALSEYKRVMERFPFSAKSLDLPIYIVRHYRLMKSPEATGRAVDEAVAYYTGLKAKAETDKGRYILAGLVGRAYVEAGQWQDALDSLDKLVRDFPQSGADEALWIKAVIYHNQLKDKTQARQELERLVKEYPRSKLVKQAENFLKKI
jgi:tetratricopeptide (TPR) repeat protein